MRARNSVAAKQLRQTDRRNNNDRHQRFPSHFGWLHFLLMFPGVRFFGTVFLSISPSLKWCPNKSSYVDWKEMRKKVQAKIK